MLLAPSGDRGGARPLEALEQKLIIEKTPGNQEEKRGLGTKGSKEENQSPICQTDVHGSELGNCPHGEERSNI